MMPRTAYFDEHHVETLSERLRDLQEGAESPLLPPRIPPHDLCPECHNRFLRDPLGKEQTQQLPFSEN